MARHRRSAQAVRTAAAPSVRIGATGHRALIDVERLSAAIDRGLDRIQAAWPGHVLVGVSPLAEGADRLIAERIAARGGRLIAALPLPREEYVHDFASAASRARFGKLLGSAAEVVVLKPARSREAAYRAVGRYVLDNCDVLLALWDGRKAQGQGGTGEIVARARARAKPLLVVRAGNRVPGSMVGTSLGGEQGRIVVERFPAEGNSSD